MKSILPKKRYQHTTYRKKITAYKKASSERTNLIEIERLDAMDGIPNNREVVFGASIQ